MSVACANKSESMREARLAADVERVIVACENESIIIIIIITNFTATLLNS